MTKEALKLALEALSKLTDVFLDTEGNHGDYERKALDQGNKAILAIKEALAQPEQEPVGFVVMERLPLDKNTILNIHAMRNWPRTQFADKGYGIALDTVTVIAFARVIEAAHGIGEEHMTKDEQIKGMANPNRGSVGVQEAYSLLLWDYQELERAFNKVTGGTWIRKSNTPSQRIWVGLTDGVMCDIAMEYGLMSIDWIDFARAIEAASRSKNT